MSLVQILRCFLRQRDSTDDIDSTDNLRLRRGVQTVYSEEDVRAAQQSPTKVDTVDLAACMHDETQRRNKLFEEVLHTQPAVRSSKARRDDGAHITYKMARAASTRVYCCGACGAWVGRPQEVVPKEQRVLRISLDDSEQTVCLDASNVRAHDQILELSAGEAWLCRVRRLCCARCDVVLGVRVDDAKRVQTAEERGHSAPFGRRLHSAPGVRACAPSESSVLQPTAPVGTLVWLEQCYLGARYLRLLDAHTDVPVHAVMPLLCTGCGRTLTFTDQLLCVKRRWGFNASPPEKACYVNSLCKANIKRRADPFEEQLAQGRMDMDDVFCACGKQVGYKFCRDKTSNLRNQHQVGRYGLVQSCLKKAPYQIFDNVYA